MNTPTKTNPPIDPICELIHRGMIAERKRIMKILNSFEGEVVREAGKVIGGPAPNDPDPENCRKAAMIVLHVFTQIAEEIDGHNISQTIVEVDEKGK